NVVKKDNKKKRKPSFYFGLTGGAELSQVKGQGMTRPGLNGGLVAGLQVSKQLAVETGVQFSQKKYYSQGKHFNPKAGSMPSNMTVNSLDGSCSLVEIPLTVKYNFGKNKNGFYTTAGVSTYIMTKEKNNYQATVSGQDQQIKSTYSNTKAYLATDLNFSAGYQQSIGKKLNIRVEPYIQIPLKGIGVGTMPVMSTGVHLVFTRNK
ncbi:MAG TPA: outer membrane beta-barrel protein, partial [Ferruginibacter sp.]|nr:outer membrane beta-barrel protein [Ferruginibacter sp.]